MSWRKEPPKDPTALEIEFQVARMVNGLPPTSAIGREIEAQVKAAFVSELPPNVVLLPVRKRNDDDTPPGAA